MPLTPFIAFESTDYMLIHMLVKSCYQDIESCQTALVGIHKYQKNAAINNKLSCQTRLLGLEANLIMAINSNLKRSEAKSIIKSVKKTNRLIIVEESWPLGSSSSEICHRVHERCHIESYVWCIQ